MPERAMRQARQTAASPRVCRLPAKPPCSWPERPSRQRAVGLQHGNLLVQQIALDQRRAELGLQPIAPVPRPSLTSSPGLPRRREKCIAPPAQRRRRDAETARDGLKKIAAAFDGGRISSDGGTVPPS